MSSRRSCRGFGGLIHSASRGTDVGPGYFAHTIPNQLSVLPFLILPPRAIQGQVSSLLKSRPNFVKSLSVNACFCNTPCKHKSSAHADTHSLSQALYRPTSTIVFSCCLYIDLYSMQRPCMCCVSHSNRCTHVPMRIMYAPDLHNSLGVPGTSSNELNWKATAFSPLITTS